MPKHRGCALSKSSTRRVNEFSFYAAARRDGSGGRAAQGQGDVAARGGKTIQALHHGEHTFDRPPDHDDLLSRTAAICGWRRGPCARDHRSQPKANSWNSARLPLYLAAGRLLSNPPVIVVPKRSQTRHSHFVGLRSVINTSNTARSPSPVACHLDTV
jgi:hypothetical protein